MGSRLKEDSPNAVACVSASVQAAGDTSCGIDTVLARDGMWVSTTVGVSMWPMLRDRRDTIVVRPCEGRLRPLDVALYRRGDAYILHRVIEVVDGGYRILGDNCLEVEDVPEAAVLGRLEEFWRGDRHCNPHSRGWLAYARVWLATWPVRCGLKRAKAALGRAARKAGLR